MRTIRRSTLVSACVAVVLTASLTLVGCGGGDDSEGSSGQEEGSSQEGITVGYAGYTVANPFFAGIAQGLEQGTEKHGYELLETNAEGDPSKQLSDIENLLVQGIDYLTMTPIDAQANIPAVRNAEEQGVPVISIADAAPEAPGEIVIQQDHTEAAELAAQAIVDFLEDRYGSPRGNVVNIMGLAGVPATPERDEGLKNVLSEYPEINIVASADGGYETDVAAQAMSNILQGESEIDAVFSANDAMAVGVISAIRNAGLERPIGHEDRIFIASIDGAKPAIDAIRQGTLDVTISQHPINMAERAIDFIAQLEAGEEIPDELIWPSQPITPDNIDSEEVQEYGIWADELEESN